jgi:uncharacterized membrane protein
MTSDRLSLVAGVGFGAGLMFLLDPRAGRRRRALLRDKMAHAAHKTGDAAGTTARDLAHRATGVAAEARARLRHDEPSDQVLVERVRAELGRVVSHPRSIEVTAKDGQVRLAGPVLAHEVKPLTAAVTGVRGVRSVDNQLEAHERRTDLPSLQGGAARPGVRPELFRSNWSPTTRLMVGAAGALLAMFGLARREQAGVMGAVLVFGAGLLARGLTGLETERLFGIWAGRRAVDVQKTIRIAAPIERVFEFWTQFENFPQFMSRVREVRPAKGGRSHWVVSGPGGVPVSWDAEVTRLIPNRVIAWKSLPGALVAHAGIIRFDREPDGSTRVHIRMSYNPPAGAVGHGIAALLGSDPKHQMDEDLARMKTLIETGKPPRDAARKAAGQPTPATMPETPVVRS